MSVTKRVIKIACIASIAFSLSGCAGTILAGLTISELLTAGSIGSTILTGKGLGEHALDIATGKDCRIIEGVFRADRDICEDEGSSATDGDFKGLVALIDEAPTPPNTDNAMFALKMLDNTEQKSDTNHSQKSLLRALTPTHQSASALPQATLQTARSELTRSTDNYTNAVASNVDIVDLRKRLTFAPSYN